MKFLMGLFTVCLVASSAFAEVAFHMGARFSGNYNMIWNVDNQLTTTDLMTKMGIPEETANELLDGNEASIKDLDKLSGMGTSFGLSFMIQPNPFFGIQPELLFSYRGRSVTLTATYTEEKKNYSYDYYGSRTYAGTTTETFELNMWYLDIPVLFHIQTPVGVFFNAGPVISFNLSADLKASIISYDIGEYVSTTVFGLIGGIGYSANLGNNQKLDIDLRVQMGLSSLIKDDIEVSDDGETAKLDFTKLYDPKDLIISLGIAYWFL